jgi:hypothetical protein
MTPEQQNIAIAEACGWANPAAYPYQNWKHPTLPSRNTPTGRPSYYSDLNACAEFERTFTGPEAIAYGNQLAQIQRRDIMIEPGDRYPKAATVHEWHATAPQRCEAFLRVRGLWKEGA